MFKKGDVVEVISADGDRSISVGQRYTLVEDESRGFVYIDDPAYQSYRSERFKLVSTSPIRTETVTTRHLEPGVYGRLRVREEAGMADGRVQVGASFVARNGSAIAVAYLSAPELRELARVALELAEYLDHVD